MQTNGIAASGIHILNRCVKLENVPQDTGYGEKAEIDRSTLDKFDNVDLSIVAKNLIANSDGTDEYCAKQKDPNIIDNTKAITFSKGESVPKIVGSNSDGTLQIDYGDYGTKESYDIAEAAYVDSLCIGSNSEFFHTSDDFLLDAAKQYATISDTTQSFVYNPTQDADYVKTAVNWFCGDNATDANYQAMSDSVNKIVKELTTKIRNGESTDLNTLTNKLSIGGNEVSVTQLEDIKQTSHTLEKGVEDDGFGTAGIVEFAMKGVRNAVAGIYSNSLSGDLKTAYIKGFKSLMDKSCESNQEMYQKYSESEHNSLEDKSSELGSKVYELFSNLDTSSKTNAISDFDNKMSDFDNILQNQYFGTGADARYAKPIAESYEQDVRSLFNTLINEI